MALVDHNVVLGRMIIVVPSYGSLSWDDSIVFMVCARCLWCF